MRRAVLIDCVGVGFYQVWMARSRASATCAGAREPEWESHAHGSLDRLCWRGGLAGPAVGQLDSDASVCGVFGRVAGWAGPKASLRHVRQAWHFERRRVFLGEFRQFSICFRAGQLDANEPRNFQGPPDRILGRQTWVRGGGGEVLVGAGDKPLKPRSSSISLLNTLQIVFKFSFSTMLCFDRLAGALSTPSGWTESARCARGMLGRPLSRLLPLLRGKTNERGRQTERNRGTDSKTGRQTDRQTEGRTDRQTDEQTHRQTDNIDR